jgi:hypothetical protein
VNLLDELCALDYSGTLHEVLSRITDDQFDAFADALNRHDTQPFLYFGLRRLAVEKGTPCGLDVNVDELGYIGGTSEMAIVTAAMERNGRIVVDWPESPFAHPDQPLNVTVTELGRQRWDELEAKGII